MIFDLNVLQRPVLVLICLVLVWITWNNLTQHETGVKIHVWTEDKQEITYQCMFEQYCKNISFKKNTYSISECYSLNWLHFFQKLFMKKVTGAEQWCSPLFTSISFSHFSETRQPSPYAVHVFHSTKIICFWGVFFFTIIFQFQFFSLINTQTTTKRKHYFRLDQLNLATYIFAFYFSAIKNILIIFTPGKLTSDCSCRYF